MFLHGELGIVDGPPHHREATMTITRRELAKGTAWAAPVILATAAAPAMAASPCAAYRAGQPLPASAFTVTYLADTAETLGRLASKAVAMEFGFRLSDEARACGVNSGSIQSTNSGGTSYFRLSNNLVYSATNSASVPANGTVGVVDSSCRSGVNRTSACGTTGVSPYGLSSATSTSSYHVTGVSLYRSITVSGYGTSIVYLNASSFTSAPTEWVGSGFSTSSTPLFSV